MVDNKPIFEVSRKYKDYFIATDLQIFGFFEDYRYLSNYHLEPVWFEGRLYPSNENAYQAAKTLDKEVRLQFEFISPNEAKKLGQTITIRKDWEQVKRNVMLQLNLQKFLNNNELRDKLLATKDRVLIEANHWGDEFWGFNIHTNLGDNHLGQVLMMVRTMLSYHYSIRHKKLED